MIKLKHLVENSTEEAYVGLSKEEKKYLRESVRSYNEYRNSLKAECVYKTASKIMEAVNLAERYVIKECNEWMEAKMVERDMKEIKKMAVELNKEANRIKDIEKQLEMLYEQIGTKLERYFEIADPAVPQSQPIQPQQETAPTNETSDNISV